jgi:hypothetical protein
LSEPEEARPPLGSVEAVEQLEDTADSVTDRIEHANKLLKRATEGGLADRDFLTGEIGSLLGLLERLDKEGRYEEEIRLAKSLHGLCVLAFRWLDLVRSLRSALGAARAAGDGAGQSWALNELGALHLCAGDPKRAKAYLEQALELQGRLGDVAGRCATRHNLDNAERDIARPLQIGARRRIVALGALAAGLVFGAGGMAFGFLAGGDETANAGAAKALEVQAGGNGQGTVLGEGIECGSDCEGTFAEGASVTLRAQASDGSVFRRWDGVDCDEGQRAVTCTLRVDGDVSLAAFFAKRPPAKAKLTVATSGDGGGSVSGAGIACGADCEETLVRGTVVTLTADEAEGSAFQRWRRVACREGARSERCTLRVDGDLTTVAFFARQSATTVSVEVEKPGQGDGLVAGGGIVCGDVCAGEFAVGRKLTLTAQADGSSLFAGWSGVECDGGTQGDAACTFTVDSPLVVEALFARAAFLFAPALGSGHVTTDVAGIDCGPACFKFPADTELTITPVVDDPDWFFSGWRDPACSRFKTDPCALTLRDNTAVLPRFDEPEG